MGQETVPDIPLPDVKILCAHRRLIDDVLTKTGTRTGKVRCLECGTIFEDPYEPQA